MAINFPAKPQPDGKEYVDPNSGKWVYDLSNNSWTLVAPGNVSPFNYRGGHDFNSATAPVNVKSGDAWTHSGADGAAINAVYIGMTGTIAAGQFVVFDGTEYTKVSSVAGYPNVGDGDGATLDSRYVKKKGETSQGIEGKLGIGTDSPSSILYVESATPIVTFRDNQNNSAARFVINRYSFDDADAAEIAVRRPGNGVATDSVMQFRVGGTGSSNEKMRIDGITGNVGIGTTNPGADLEIAGSSARIRLNRTDGTNTYGEVSSSTGGLFISHRNNASNGQIIFQGNGGGTPDEYMRIDSSGRLLVGTTTNFDNFRDVGTTANRTPRVQVSSGNGPGSGLAQVAWKDTSANPYYAPHHWLARSNSATPGVNAAVVDGLPLGVIAFAGDDGATFLNAASISSYVDGTPGTNDMPGRLVFSTTADGASSPTERMRITNEGRVCVADGGGTTSARFKIGGNSLYSPTTWASFAQISCQVASNTTSAATMLDSFVTTQAASFTLNDLQHFSAGQGAIGAGSTVSNQFGFRARGSLTGATNNYGFRSEIASGTGRWNFYAAGTATNYFAGDVRVGASSTANVVAGSADGAFIDKDGIYTSGKTAATSVEHFKFYNPNGQVGSIATDGSATAYNTSSDYRLKENVTPMVGAADRVKALKPCRFNFKADADKTVDGFLAHEAQEVVPEAVTGTKDATEAIGTLFDWDGSVREENVTEPKELTYSEEVIDDPGQEGKEAVYSEPVLIQEYQPAVWGEPELIKEGTEDEEAVYGDPVLISPEVPEQWSEPELISPAVEHRDPTYKTVTRQMSWEKTGDRDVMQGIDQSKLVPLLTAALQEALGRIEALEAALSNKGA